MAKLKTWDEVIKEALYVHTHKENYCYIYGAKWEVMTEEKIRALMNYYTSYFSRYTAAQKEEIVKKSVGKIGSDCSGFIQHLTGDATYSGAQYQHCLNKSTNLAAGPAGSILWKQGHIGLDIGYGYFLHFPTELKSCEIGKISEYVWTNTGLSPYIDYTGADAR